MRYLITGGCGFIGSNLAAEVLKRGETDHQVKLSINWGAKPYRDREVMVTWENGKTMPNIKTAR